MQVNLLIGVLGLIAILYVMKVIMKSRVIEIIIRVCVGVLMIVMLNCILPQYMIALNLYTVGFAACLGLPGVMTLFMLQFIL